MPVPLCMFSMANLHTALVHIIGALIALGYAQNYYFHLRMYWPACSRKRMTNSRRPPQEQRPPLSVSHP